MISSVSNMHSMSAMPGMSAMAGMRKPPSAEEMFSRVDADGSGSVDKTELQGMIDKVSQRTGESLDVDEVLASADTNGDGAVDQTEFASILETFRPSGPPPRPAPKGPEESMQTLLDMMDSSDEETSNTYSSALAQYSSNHLSASPALLDMLG